MDESSRVPDHWRDGLDRGPATAIATPLCFAFAAGHAYSTACYTITKVGSSSKKTKNKQKIESEANKVASAALTMALNTLPYQTAVSSNFLRVVSLFRAEILLILVTVMLRSIQARGSVYRWRLFAAFAQGRRHSQSGSRHHSARPIISTASGSSRRRSFALAAAANDFIPPRRTSNAVNFNSSSGRPLPPTLDSMYEEEGFGAYDFVPDEYDLADMQQQEAFFEENVAFSQKKSKPASPVTSKPSPPVVGEVASSNDDKVITTDDANTADTNTVARTITAEKTSTGSDEQSLTATVEQAQESAPLNNTSREYDRGEDFFRKASSGMGISSELDILEDRLEELKKEACVVTNNPKFNPNSPQQVSEVLYGYTGAPTNKDVLEALAASENKLADLIIRFRHLSREFSKKKKRRDNREKGSYVKSVYTVKRESDATAEKVQEYSTTDATSKNREAEEINTKTKSAKPRPSIIPEDPLLLVDASAYIFRA
jgi:hypothetical protein